MKRDEMPKVFCPKCETEMVVLTSSDDGDPDPVLPVAKCYLGGRLYFEMKAFWYSCPKDKCGVSAGVLPNYPEDKDAIVVERGPVDD